MKKVNLSFCVLLLVLILAGCKKQIAPGTATLSSATGDAGSKTAAALACQPGIYNLAVDPSTGFSYLYKVSGSPSAPPVNVSPINGSLATNQLITCAGAPIRFASGLAYDPNTGIFYGTTGASGSPANHIFRFTDPNCVTTTPAVASCAISLDLSDVERDPVSGAFFAINRSVVNPNNRIVKLGLPVSATVNCLPNFISSTIYLRGLTFDCGGRLYAMQVAGTNGRLLDISTASGLITATYSYPGPITPPAVNIPEMGLHYDCLCIKQFITGNYDPITQPPYITDGLPSGLGGPLYNFLSGVLKPTVDFARP